ncbi:uncharacterized protein LOC133866051 [Alnus glutinosa]|uniref:uncharacterized protein LOC133866051 n=1 Tax=Alnus glutinosa TaxID=3517 RepID=UPI002D785A70|nr:uncharacterized protein LOC133866051 [Alnus glutinosa]
MEAWKIIFSWRPRNVFTQITLTLILPLSFIALAHMEASKLLFPNTIHNEIVFNQTQAGAPKYHKLSDLTSERITFWLFVAAYFTFVLIFSLVSTSAVVYTIACIYTGREVTFEKVMSVVPKVLKRLMLTFVSTFVAVFAYSIVASLLMLIFITLVIFLASVKFLVPIVIVLGIVYVAGLVYMAIVWQLASVVTVLEDTCGFRAMMKSKALIKGKTGVATIISLMFNISVWLVQVAFEKLVVRGESSGMVSRVAIGIICLLLLSKLTLFGLVIHTVIYLVCKSYHHENIDKPALSDHLEVNLGEYVPLKPRDVQLV